MGHRLRWLNKESENFPSVSGTDLVANCFPVVGGVLFSMGALTVIGIDHIIIEDGLVVVRIPMGIVCGCAGHGRRSSIQVLARGGSVIRRR